MTNGIEVGIDLIAHNLGELPAGKTYLLAGERQTAKTTFLLQFLYQGLKEHRPCVLVTDKAPKAVMALAQSLGMDLIPFLKDGMLIVYEIARKEPFPPSELFGELETALAEHPAARLALDGLSRVLTAAEAGGGAAGLLAKLEAAKTTCFVALETPVAPPLSPLKEELEDAAAGSFVMKSTAEENVKSFSVRRLVGARTDGAELPFRVDAGRGIVEIIKTGGIKFPRQDEH